MKTFLHAFTSNHRTENWVVESFYIYIRVKGKWSYRKWKTKSVCLWHSRNIQKPRWSLCERQRRLLVPDAMSLTIAYKESKKEEIYKEKLLTVWDRIPYICPSSLCHFLFTFFHGTFRFAFPFLTFQWSFLLLPRLNYICTVTVSLIWNPPTIKIKLLHQLK
jgi:hypothetical protein